MKQLWMILLVLPLLFTACGDDECPDDPLQHDGANVTGPILPAGIHEFAVRFADNELCGHLGKSLSDVRFFIGDTPSILELVIYGEGTETTPGGELYSANLTNAFVLQDWTNHIINEPIEITGEDIWIALRVSLSGTQASVGCDGGPNQTDGDWLLRANDGQWIPFRERSPGESVNWNIRGFAN